jgi:hypothetical protein
MITVLRAHGLRLAIYQDDHDPPHVHVYGDGEAKIALVGDSGRAELIYARDMKNAELRRALTIVSENQAMLLARWKDING